MCNGKTTNQKIKSAALIHRLIRKMLKQQKNKPNGKNKEKRTKNQRVKRRCDVRIESETKGTRAKYISKIRNRSKS